MRLHFLAVSACSAIALSSCRPTGKPAAPTPQQPVSDSRPARAGTPQILPETIAALPAPGSPRLAGKTISGIVFEGVSFDSRTHRLVVADQAHGPGSIWSSSEEVARRRGALLAINAGFFTPEGAPLGLVVSSGKTSGAWNSASSLGSGIYREPQGGLPSISRRSSRSAVSGSRELIQAGPLLLENSSPVRGLDGEKSALRSLILTDGGTRWWIGKTSSCTLAALGRAIDNSSPAPWKISDALNLDGGRSTDLFISSSVPGGPVNRRGFLNRPVRNFLLLRAK